MIGLFSQLLPHKGGFSPLFSHRLPYVPALEIDSSNTIVRMNGRAAIDKRTLKRYAYFLI
jgi:hypothetical protein